MGLDFSSILEAVKSLGVTKGLFVVFFFIAHAWIYKLYNGRLEDRQKEIDRMAKDISEYRERFLALMDKSFSHKPISRKPNKTEENK